MTDPPVGGTHHYRALLGLPHARALLGWSLLGRLPLGAEGMNMGTRFMATREAPIHDNVKQALLAFQDSCREA